MIKLQVIIYGGERTLGITSEDDKWVAHCLCPCCKEAPPEYTGTSLDDIKDQLEVDGYTIINQWYDFRGTKCKCGGEYCYLEMVDTLQYWDNRKDEWAGTVPKVFYESTIGIGYQCNSCMNEMPITQKEKDLMLKQLRALMSEIEGRPTRDPFPDEE